MDLVSDVFPGAREGAAVRTGGPPDVVAAAHADDRPLLALLDTLGPGPELASALASLDEAELDDFAVLEVLAAWERVAAWAQAGSARVLAEMLERTRGSSRHEFVADAVASRLGRTRQEAAQLVTVAHGTARLPEVVNALASGVVDRRKAEALIDAGRLPDERRREVVASVLPDAEHLTAPQLRSRMRRAEIAIDPDGAQERHEASRAERYVRLEPADDAMAYLTAYLPADAAARAFAAVDDLGQASRGVVRVSVAASTLLGSDDLPAILAGHGPIPAAMARALASDPDAVWQRLFTDPSSGVLTDVSSRSYRPSERLRAAVVARDVTCTFPGCRVPAASSDLDHVEPYDPGSDAVQTHGGNLHALCRTHHRAKTVGGWRVARDPSTGTTTWTAPTGHRFARGPEPQDPRVASRQDQRSRYRAARQDRDGPPPF
ncbi:HNH endonuclease [Isoptericola sp. 4D.3]|uniref:HNH endonuclease n=1 Tax=Isoptericola peretonis TaxID=2918523 RepID=A0ABT0J4V2_9MICO|nr:HNH endonuclease [Isoptericola sp. 4D.3]